MAKCLKSLGRSSGQLLLHAQDTHREVFQGDQQDIAALLSAAGGVDDLLPGAVLQVDSLSADLPRPGTATTQQHWMPTGLRSTPIPNMVAPWKYRRQPTAES